MTTNDAVARVRDELHRSDGYADGLTILKRDDLRAVLDRLENTERERDEARIVAINDGQKLIELRKRLEAAEYLLYEADQISRLIEPDFYEWRERYERFGGSDDK